MILGLNQMEFSNLDSNIDLKRIDASNIEHSVYIKYNIKR